MTLPRLWVFLAIALPTLGAVIANLPSVDLTYQLRAGAETALDPGAAEAQHDMRIAAKRLRYVLEIVGPCFGPEAKAARRAARELQNVLGEIHDCDVLLPRAEGVPSLMALLHTRRELLFRRFRDLWRLEESKGTWAALERAL